MRALFTAVVVAGSSAFGVEAIETDASASTFDRPRVELVLYPVRAQINPLSTMHVGSSGAVQLRLSDAFAFQISGGYDWLSTESAFQTELVESFRVERLSQS
ncbi:MAG: hypothetical protein JNM17_29080, partial [Archangium sp.]|nr:hypothetical protein [Archangium sp.]